MNKSFFAYLCVVLCLAIGLQPVVSQAQDATSQNAPTSQAQRGREAPEEATGVQEKKLVVADKHMVVAANPHATRAGRDILRAGGSAVDAAIAVQLVLNLVEPQSSGIGGGAFLLHYDKAKDVLTTYDGRETAPQAAKPDRFLIDGKRKPFRKVVRSGISVGVPGMVRMFELAHKKYGKLPWQKLFEPAIQLADKGFAVLPRLNGLLQYAGLEHFDEKARAYFFDADGKPWPVGHVLANPEFANTLRSLAREGANAFYNGPLADVIVSAVQDARNFAGDMTLADLAQYEAKTRRPLCVVYRQVKKICGMGPPSSGGMTVAQSLLLFERANERLPKAEAGKAAAMHVLAEAEKLAFADRRRYIADSDFVPVPSGLLDHDYLTVRAQEIAFDKAMAKAKAGLPPGLAKKTFGHDHTFERSGTSHISIIDGYGNAVSMTSSIEGAFGSGTWAAGFLLNNELTDFSFLPVDQSGTPIANRIEAGKRPRSSMSPTIVFDTKTNEVEAVLGSPGGSRIILYVTKALVALLDWEMDAQQAAAFPNFGARRGMFEIEEGVADAEVYEKLLASRGHKIRRARMTSGLHIITLRNGRLQGGADPRREGIALGD